MQGGIRRTQWDRNASTSTLEQKYLSLLVERLGSHSHRQIAAERQLQRLQLGWRACAHIHLMVHRHAEAIQFWQEDCGAAGLWVG
ncbi:hypothetical protein [Xenorhabdus nematophila]|uniref:hypothetical protein n=1 Tax=Xenorhabdus nematophila TaxID=628 RepID=UPI000B01A4A3|nr:hypothetical protein [Xenorhabdus nematophila]